MHKSKFNYSIPVVWVGQNMQISSAHKKTITGFVVSPTVQRYGKRRPSPFDSLSFTLEPVMVNMRVKFLAGCHICGSEMLVSSALESWGDE